MSKYTDMCEAIKKARSEWATFHQESLHDAVAVANGFINYAGIPRENIFFLPLDRERDENKIYTPAGALNYEKDGFWHFGLGLTLSGQRFLLEVCVARRKGKTLLRRGSGGPIHEINVGDEMQKVAFYDELSAWMMNYLGADSFDPLDGTTTKKIGFHN